MCTQQMCTQIYITLQLHVQYSMMYASLQIQIPKYSYAGCNICAQTHRRTDEHSHTELMPKATQLHLL